MELDISRMKEIDKNIKLLNSNRSEEIMSREDIILKVANNALETEKELMSQDIIYFEKKKKSLKENNLSEDENKLKEWEIDTILAKDLASRFATLYNYTDPEDFIKIVKKGMARGKCQYEENINNNQTKESDEEFIKCIIESITETYGEYISEYINSENDYNNIKVKDIEIIKKFRDAKIYIDTTDIEMTDLELVLLLSNSNEEDTLNNYRLLEKLAIINPVIDKEKKLIKKDFSANQVISTKK